MTTGQRLQKYIKDTWRSQKEFADKVGLSEKSLNRYTSDSLFPEKETLIKFQKAGLSITWLICGRGAMRIDADYDSVKRKLFIAPDSDRKFIKPRLSLN